jgi:hypothetical protein
MPEGTEVFDAMQVLREKLAVPRDIINDLQVVLMVCDLLQDLKVELAVAKAKLEIMEKRTNGK